MSIRAFYKADPIQSNIFNQNLFLGDSVLAEWETGDTVLWSVGGWFHVRTMGHPITQRSWQRHIAPCPRCQWHAHQTSRSRWRRRRWTTWWTAGHVHRTSDRWTDGHVQSLTHFTVDILIWPRHTMHGYHLGRRKKPEYFTVRPTVRGTGGGQPPSALTFSKW